MARLWVSFRSVMIGMIVNHNHRSFVIGYIVIAKVSDSNKVIVRILIDGKKDHDRDSDLRSQY